MSREILLTPGPTHVPPQVFAAMQNPTMHHRTDAFKKELRAALNGVRRLLDIDSDPVLIAGSGTAAMEAALLNICRPGDQIIVVNGGKFGERWLSLARALELNAVELRVEWGSSAETAAVIDLLKQNSSARALCLQQCETSTGALHPVEEICKAAKKVSPDILTVVDAVSSIATMPLYPDRMQIDVLVAAAHKGLMLPPGLALLALSSSAWRAAESNKIRTLYFNLLLERKAHAKDSTSWTPAMNHILGLNAALAMIGSEGLGQVFERHVAFAEACRAAAREMGLEIFAKHPAPGVTSLRMPDGIDGDKVRSRMLQAASVRIAGGQDELKGRIIRIGHMGFVSADDLRNGLAALEEALLHLGCEFQAGSAAAAFEGYLKERASER
ncbi:MAG: alanine--glyoxylate aminotransferase family protein [Deltaproteobacteria bacterium]|nr:alanine--glyoxylate aminotransferase family protein [Deltaproteobacteria bacterium]